MFRAPVDGVYRVTCKGGSGGYIVGDVHLNAGHAIYVYVGGSGNAGYDSGSAYNRGGTNTVYSGGGVTDLRLIGGAWNNTTGIMSRIAVAGDGGGSDNYHARSSTGYNGNDGPGGDGGGLVGQPGGSSENYIVPAGTQNSGYMSGMAGCAAHYSGITFTNCYTQTGARVGDGFARIVLASRDS